MKIYIRSIVLACCVSSSFSAPWGGGSVGFNPISGGFLTGRGQGPSSPPFYNPGPGNLAPAFSYTQQPLYSQTNQTNLSEKAQQIIAKWNLLAKNFRETPEKITFSIKAINKDRNILNESAQSGRATPQDMNQVAQIQMLMNLAEIRQYTKLLKSGQKAFPDTYEKMLKINKSINPRDRQQQSPLPESWYIDKRDRLRSLLQKFKDFISKYPQYSDNPPPQLVGLSSTLKDGINALAEYDKLANCLISPNQDMCSVLAERDNDRDSGVDDTGDGEDDEQNYQNNAQPYGFD